MPAPLRIETPVLADVNNDPTSLLHPRATPSPSGSTPSGPSIGARLGIGIGVAVLILLTVSLTLYSRNRGRRPKTTPGRSLRKWWQRNKAKYEAAHDGDTEHQPDMSRPSGGRTTHNGSSVALQDAREREATRDRSGQRRSQSSLGATVVGNTTATTTTISGSRNLAGNAAAVAAVDRNTSVRSVMTLPAYRVKANDQEHTIGREGERDGVDIVVEHPTAEEDEERREEEMDSLFQIRLARRRQIAEREERRRLRREAAERGDTATLRDLREQGRNATTANTAEVEDLRSRHEQVKETRARAVSSVSYQDLGVARADGTRLRANSNESERMGLLSDAASIARSTQSGLGHRRDRSTASVLSIDSGRSNEYGHAQSRSRTSSFIGGDGRRASSTMSHYRAGSSPEIISSAEVDLGDSSMPPPDYDDVSLNDEDDAGLAPSDNRHRRPSMTAASGRNSPYADPPPDYTSPAQSRQNTVVRRSGDVSERVLPQLPSLRLGRLPSIVIEPSSAAPRDDHEHVLR